MPRIRVIKADGTKETKLIYEKGYNFEDITWSPDGRYIAFTSLPSILNVAIAYIEHKIYIINTDGTNKRLLTTNPGTMPSWWMP